MLMTDLLETKMFRLLSEPSQVTNEEMQNAYGCFMEHLKTTVSQFENFYSEVFRMLNVTRVELVFIETHYQHEQGGKCPEISLPAKGTISCQC